MLSLSFKNLSFKVLVIKRKFYVFQQIVLSFCIIIFTAAVNPPDDLFKSFKAIDFCASSTKFFQFYKLNTWKILFVVLNSTDMN